MNFFSIFIFFYRSGCRGNNAVSSESEPSSPKKKRRKKNCQKLPVSCGSKKKRSNVKINYETKRMQTSSVHNVRLFFLPSGIRVWPSNNNEQIIKNTESIRDMRKKGDVLGRVEVEAL